MILVKQVRVTTKHPDGVDVMVPLPLAYEGMVISRTKTDVVFTGDAGGLASMPIETYRKLSKTNGCCCGTGLFS